MSSKDESQSIGNVLGALGSRASSSEQAGSPEGLASQGWEQATSSKKGKSRIGRYIGSTRPSEGPAHEASSLTEGEDLSL